MSISWSLDNNEPFIIAEIGQNHDGSLGMCHAYIDAIAEAGAHAIKFQTHIASAESTQDEPFRVKFSHQDATRYDYWRRMEFRAEQWVELKKHADAKGIVFLSTPFSLAAVELLESIDVPAWKVGSGDTMSADMLRSVAATGKPILLSTGMSSWSEINSIVQCFREGVAAFALLQCTSKYPTPLADVGLNVLNELRIRFGCRVGLSDHSGSLTPSMVAVARGFNLIEVHATFDRRMFGPDVSSSLTIEQIRSLVFFANDVRVLDEHPVDKDMMAHTLQAQKMLFGRSVALIRDCPSGHVLIQSDLAPKKPGSGIPWADKESLVGRVLRYNVSADRLLKLEDLEENA